MKSRRCASSSGVPNCEGRGDVWRSGAGASGAARWLRAEARPARPARARALGVHAPGKCMPGDVHGTRTVIVGMRLWCAYSSLRRLTRSIQMPRTCGGGEEGGGGRDRGTAAGVGRVRARLERHAFVRTLQTVPRRYSMRSCGPAAPQQRRGAPSCAPSPGACSALGCS